MSSATATATATYAANVPATAVISLSAHLLHANVFIVDEGGKFVRALNERREGPVAFLSVFPSPAGIELSYAP